MQKREPNRKRRENRDGLPVVLPNRFDDRARVDPLVDVKRDSRNVERSSFCFPGPNQLRVEMRVVGVNCLSGFLIRLGRYQPNRRIVNPLFSLVIVLFNSFLLRLRRLRHSRVSLPSAVGRGSRAGSQQFNPLGTYL